MRKLPDASLHQQQLATARGQIVGLCKTDAPFNWWSWRQSERRRLLSALAMRQCHALKQTPERKAQTEPCCAAIDLSWLARVFAHSKRRHPIGARVALALIAHKR